jgi:PAS domain S-box-containing protein
VGSSGRVLIIAPDVVSRHLLVSLLESGGIQCEQAGSGESALSSLAQMRPDVALIDHLPNVAESLSIISKLREAVADRTSRIIAVVPSDDDDSIDTLIRAGVDDVVRKPLRQPELVARIKAQLACCEGATELAQARRHSKATISLMHELARTIGRRDILLSAARCIACVLRVGHCTIVTRNDREGEEWIIASTSDQSVFELAITPSHSPLLSALVSTGQTTILDGAQAQSLMAEPALARFSTTKVDRLLVLPISNETRTVGVSIAIFDAGDSIARSDVELGESIATVAAIASRAALSQPLRDRTEDSFSVHAERDERLVRVAAFFDTVGDGILAIDSVSGQILASNPAARAISGYSEAQLRQTNLRTLAPPAALPQVAAIQNGFRESNFPHDIDLPMVRNDSVELIVNSSFSHAMRDYGVVLMAFRDVTSQRRADAELRNTKAFLERVIDSSAEAIISFDRFGVVTLLSRAAQSCLGYQSGDVVGKLSISNLFSPSGCDALREVLSSQQPSTSTQLLQTHALSSTREPIPVALSASVLLDGDQLAGVVAVFADLRERINMEARLLDAEEQARDRERRAIVAELAGTTAHELNQPLTSVMAYAQLLRRKVGADSPAIDAIDVIEREADRMAEIVRKIGKITHYATTSYVGNSKILDLDRAASGVVSRKPPAP